MADGVVEADLAVQARPGLLNTAETVVESNRWMEAFSFEADPCGGGHIVDPCQMGAGGDTGDTFTCVTVGPIQPYVVEASETVSTFGNPAGRQDERVERVRRKLLAIQSKLVEAEFWSGTKAIARGWTNNQYLSNPTGLTVLGTAPVGGVFGYVDGLAALEQAIADGTSWDRGAIHASRQMVTHWIHADLVRAVPNPPTGTLLTELGTPVIAGAGYPGTGPQGAINPNRLEWAYATPMPQVRLSDVFFNDTDSDVVAVDRSTNDRTVRAHRFASVTFSPCFRAGALITMTTALQVPGS